jgi:hypothetical protein
MNIGPHSELNIQYVLIKFRDKYPSKPSIYVHYLRYLWQVYYHLALYLLSSTLSWIASGIIKSIMYLDFYCWYSLLLPLLARKSRYSCATSTYAPKTINGGGDLSSPLARVLFIHRHSQFTIITRDLTSIVLQVPYYTLAGPVSWRLWYLLWQVSNNQSVVYDIS